MDESTLNAFESRVWHAIKALSGTVYSRIEIEIRDASGLSGSEYGVLSRLQDIGQGKLLQQFLAESMKWHKSRLSHQLTRMESRDFVRRHVAGRRVEVIMRPAGKRALEIARPAHARAVRKYLIERLTREEAEILLSISVKISE